MFKRRKRMYWFDIFYKYKCERFEISLYSGTVYYLWSHLRSDVFSCYLHTQKVPVEADWMEISFSEEFSALNPAHQLD